MFIIRTSFHSIIHPWSKVVCLFCHAKIRQNMASSESSWLLNRSQWKLNKIENANWVGNLGLRPQYRLFHSFQSYGEKMLVFKWILLLDIYTNCTKIGFGRKHSVEASMCFTLEVNGTNFTSNHEMIEVTNLFQDLVHQFKTCSSSIESKPKNLTFALSRTKPKRNTFDFACTKSFRSFVGVQ
jgi:hypothetical protein